MQVLKKIVSYIRGKRLLRIAIGVVIGAVAGYLYYRLIGCKSGSCAITSNPLISTLYGAVAGGVITAI